MAVTYKDIDLLTKKSALDGTEKFPVSDTQYATPAQIVIGGSAHTTLTPDSTTTGKIKQTDGSDNTNSSFSYNTYSITPGKTYLFSGRFGSNVSANNKFVLWLNRSGNVVSYEPYGADEQSTVSYSDKAVVAPAAAAYMVLNIQNYYSSYAVVKSVGDIIPTALADLRDDSTHRVVTDTEKSTWNAKSDFSGSYNDLTNTPDLSVYQETSNLVTSISSSSTDTEYPSAKCVYDAIPTVNDSTITLQMNGSTVDTFTTNASSAKTINLGGNFPKYFLCADEAAYTAITTKDSGTLYLIPES